MPATAASVLLPLAQAQGYDELSDRDIKKCLLYVAQSPGGSGSAAVTQQAGDPVAPPADPTSAALNTNTTNGVLFFWNVANQAWE